MKFNSPRLEHIVLSLVVAFSCPFLATDAHGEPALRASEPIEVGSHQMAPVEAEVDWADIECAPGGRCMVIWEERGTGLWMTLFDRGTGAPVSASHLGSVSGRAPSLGYADGKFVVAWTYHEVALRAQIIDAETGTQLEAPVELMAWRDIPEFASPQQPHVVVSGGGGKFLVAWELYRPSHSDRVAMARWLGEDGELLGSLVEPYPSDEEHEPLDIDYDGARLRLLTDAEAVGTTGTSGLHVMSADPNTADFAAQSQLIDGEAAGNASQACLSDQRCLVVWRTAAGGSWNFRAGLRDASGQWLWQPQTLSAVDGHSKLHVFATSEAFVILAYDSRGDTAVDTMYVSLDGQVSEPTELLLPAEENLSVVDVAHDGQYTRILARDSSRQIVVLSFDPDGQVVARDENLTYKESDFHHVELVTAGENTLLAWSTDTLQGLQIHATAVTPDGVPLAAQGVPVGEDLGAEEFVIAADGSGFILAWTTTDERIRLRRLEIDGDQLLPGDHVEFDDLIGPFNALHLARAGDLVVLALNEDEPLSSPVSVLVGDMTGDFVKLKPATSDTIVVGLACAEDGGQCVVALQQAGVSEGVLRFASFRPSLSEQDISFDNDHLPTSAQRRASLGLSRVDARLIASFVDPDGSDTPVVGLYEVSDSGELQQFTTLTDLPAVRIGPVFATDAGAAISFVRAAEPYGYASSLALLDHQLEPLAREPLDSSINGLRMGADVFARRPGGGFLTAARVRGADGEQSSRLLVQAFGMPGEAGEECRGDFDCVSGVCAEARCGQAGGGDGGGDPHSGADAGPDADSAADQPKATSGGCSHTSGPNGDLLAAITAILLLAGSLRLRRSA